MLSKQTLNKVPTPPLRRYPDGKQGDIDSSLFFPTNIYFYHNKIKTIPSNFPLFDLPQRWNDMLRSMLGPEYPVSDGVETNTRLRWFEVEGDNVQVSNDEERGKLPDSSSNWTHHLLVIDEILPALRTLYGLNLRSNVIIFVPYERQRQVYNAALGRLLYQSWRETEIPEVWTITAASEGHHNVTANVAILDLVKSKGGPELGFLQNDDRAAIMFTRGRKACLVVSGDLHYNPDDNWLPGTDEYAREKGIKWEAERQGRTPTYEQLSSDNAVSYYDMHARSYRCTVRRAAKKYLW
ncbi:hypothetical protein LTR15_001384 [Elasticomyces elasticus]|nr:hypothetical protein LTR15_001384 [Elasticomyces elasticus]